MLCMETDEINSTANYCRQCSGEMHQDCMIQLLNQSKKNAELVACGNKTEGQGFLLFPPLEEHILRYILSIFLGFKGGKLIAKKLYSQADETDSFALQQKTLLFDSCASTIKDVERTMTIFKSVDFVRKPSAKCIQCRFETNFIAQQNERDKQEKFVSRTFIATYIFHIWIVSCTTLFLHYHFISGLGLLSLILPLPSITYFITWMIIGGPLVLLWPGFFTKLRSIAYDQGKLASMLDNRRDERFLRQCTYLCLDYDREGEDVTMFVGYTQPNAICEEIMDHLVPFSINSIFATTEGIALAQMVWTGKQSFSMDGTPLNIEFCKNTSSLDIETRNSSEANSEAAKNRKERFAIAFAAIIAALPAAGWYGGLSLSASLTFYSLFGFESLWQLFALGIIAENVRLSLYAYFAWRWLPMRFPSVILQPLVSFWKLTTTKK